jgi:hypothetical protein
MKKAVKWIFGLGAVTLVGLQFFNPALTNPVVPPGGDLMSANPPPAEVAALLHNACYDCHSYETKWPWYSHVAPVSWLQTSHVYKARDAMNFSDWPHDDPALERGALKHIGHEVETGRMPLPSYTWIHRASRLTPAQRKELTDWAAKALAAVKN